MRCMGFGSAGEMLFLFVLALVVLGPKRLPELARQLGKFMNEFKRASNEFKYQIESEINNLDLQEKRDKQQILPPVQPSIQPAAEPEASSAPIGTIASGMLREPEANSAPSETSSHSAASELSSAEPVAPSSVPPSSAPEAASAKGSDA